jgi:hypothetical protein
VTSEKAVRQQLGRILASATFRQVDRLKRFLNFIVVEAAEGRADQLKEYVIGVQVFDKESSFDPRADPIVRVQARRLRTRLVRCYREEGGSDPLVIELPKGGYAPVFKARDPGMSGRRSLALLSRDRTPQGPSVRRLQRERRSRLLLSRIASGNHPRAGANGGASRHDRAARKRCRRASRHG